jgi:hypothetical protein
MVPDGAPGALLLPMPTVRREAAVVPGQPVTTIGQDVAAGSSASGNGSPVPDPVEA